MNRDEILAKLIKVDPRRREKERVNWTIPGYIIDLLKEEQQEKGYKSVSQLVADICVDHFIDQ